MAGAVPGCPESPPAPLPPVPADAGRRARLPAGTLRISASFPPPGVPLRGFPSPEQLGTATGGCHSQRASSSQARGHRVLGLVRNASPQQWGRGWLAML